MEIPQISVILPTFNNAATIGPCLESIINQTLAPFEIIIIDGGSTDSTLKIAALYQVQIIVSGKERCQQANIGVSRARGEFVIRLDADFVLNRDVLEVCAQKALSGYDAVEIHNEPDATVGWIARARNFEYELLRGDLLRVSPRFIRRNLYLQVEGLNENLVAGEDFDFMNKITRAGAKIAIGDSAILHLGEPKNIWVVVRKFYVYGRQTIFFKANAVHLKGQIDVTSIWQKLYVRKWRVYIARPVDASLFICYFGIKILAGGVGMAREKIHPGNNLM